MHSSRLEQLYDAHADALYAFLLQLTRCEADAADLVQEVFAKLWRRPDWMARWRNPRAALLRMGHNAFIDSLRRRTVRRRAVETYATDWQCFVGEDDPDPDESESVIRALAELPAEQRAVVHLKVWESMTFRQIARALRISPNTAASRWRYATDKLRVSLRHPLREPHES